MDNIDQDIKHFAIKLLEDITQGTLSRDTMLRQLLKLYDRKELYFYHYSYIKNGSSVYTNELIECSKEYYVKILSNEFDRSIHKPVKYNIESIPTDKKIRTVIYNERP